MENSNISFSITSILHIVLQVLFYITGLYIQIKVIFVCWKERTGNTWYIHLTQSIIVIVYFTLHRPFWIVTIVIPNLSAHTGEWFCYVAAFIFQYSLHIITSNSFLIAMMKYVFIVHNLKVLSIGKEIVQKIFFTIYLFLPLVFATIASIGKDFDSRSELISCFGLTQQTVATYNTTASGYQKFLLCQMTSLDKEILHGSTFYVMLQCLCIVKNSLVIIINTNVPEAFLYYKIFKKMKR